MGEETSDTMNLDLNLGPAPEIVSGSPSIEGVNLDDLVDNPFDRIREAVRRRRWRWHQVPIPAATQSLTVEFDQFRVNSGSANTMQAGEGSVVVEERTSDVPKSCEATYGFSEDRISEDRKDDIEKGVSNDGSFFDCNICLDLARDPVVTCCGHLFCWSCLYRWLHMHSDANECPVCKGEEMIRQIGSRFDLVRDPTPPREANGSRGTVERTDSMLNRILTSREFRGDQNAVLPLDDVDLTPSSTTGTEAMSSRIQSLYPQRQSYLRRAARFTTLSALSSAERMAETNFRGNLVGRNQEQQPAVVDDRDSFSSIAAVINSESQMDTAVEIDSMVSLSASSSRRRNDVLRVSDVDSGDSRAHRRRRLN
ncbi:hypothetical protein F3Y22_tig00111941pilonHSYRG00071 [Hibiscus syriacus]|uniref:E3 ubiquitin-protein ligase RMA n=1 Tax=Hibiscus syriacus TaxID=106335 RepID=A0A6A2YEW3_HIBSY|nr:hypothetical protein F3Y22_tig00111941pilonHSYRG00071 [Hibiscus syriacus]